MQYETVLRDAVPALLRTGDPAQLEALLVPLVSTLRNGDLDQEAVGQVLINCLYPYAAILQDEPLLRCLSWLRALRPLWQQVGTRALGQLGVERPWVTYVEHADDLYRDMTAQALHVLLDAG